MTSNDATVSGVDFDWSFCKWLATLSNIVRMVLIRYEIEDDQRFEVTRPQKSCKYQKQKLQAVPVHRSYHSAL